jgi:hypothetical protein
MCVHTCFVVTVKGDKQKVVLPMLGAQLLSAGWME